MGAVQQPETPKGKVDMEQKKDKTKTNAMDINPADEEKEKSKGEPLASNMKKKNKNTAGDEDKSRIPALRVDVERKVSWKAKAPASKSEAREKAKTGNAL